MTKKGQGKARSSRRRRKKERQGKGAEVIVPKAPRAAYVESVSDEGEPGADNDRMEAEFASFDDDRELPQIYKSLDQPGKAGDGAVPQDKEHHKQPALESKNTLQPRCSCHTVYEDMLKGAEAMPKERTEQLEKLLIDEMNKGGFPVKVPGPQPPRHGALENKGRTNDNMILGSLLAGPMRRPIVVHSSVSHAIGAFDGASQSAEIVNPESDTSSEPDIGADIGADNRKGQNNKVNPEKPQTAKPVADHSAASSNIPPIPMAYFHEQDKLRRETDKRENAVTGTTHIPFTFTEVSPAHLVEAPRKAKPASGRLNNLSEDVELAQVSSNVCLPSLESSPANDPLANDPPVNDPTVNITPTQEIMTAHHGRATRASLDATSSASDAGGRRTPRPAQRIAHNGLLEFKASPIKTDADHMVAGENRRKVSLGLPINVPKPLETPPHSMTQRSPSTPVEQNDLEYQHRHTFIGPASLEEFLENLEISPTYTTTQRAVLKAFGLLACDEQIQARQSSVSSEGWSFVARVTHEDIINRTDSLIESHVKLGSISLRKFLASITFDEKTEVEVTKVVEAFYIASALDVEAAHRTDSKAKAFRNWLVMKKATEDVD